MLESLKRHLYLIVQVCVLSLSFGIYSQSTDTINAHQGSYNIDQKHKMIVYNYTSSDSIQTKNKSLTHIRFDQLYAFSENVDTLSYQKSYKIKNQDQEYILYATSLPIISINTKDSIINDPKRPSKFTYADKDTIFSALAGIELRGNISLGFPKKSYDLEFWEDANDKKSVDKQFDQLRSDDDWILDGLYNEAIRIRSYFCNKLWLSIHTPHYISKDKDAKSGIDLMYAEVFLNSEYLGIHTLSEQVDRKLLQLKKYKDQRVRGELFKAASYKGAPGYKSAPKYKNIFPHWAGYKVEYPFVNYKAQWKNIHHFTKFVIKSKDSRFKKKIAKKFDLNNAIDYFLFINLVRATDNMGKNFYVAKYSKKALYFNVPWDLDGVLGTIQDGKRIPTTDDILSNGLFDRLLKVNPNNYRTRLKERWLQLRKDQFSETSLFKAINETHTSFEKNKIYEREQTVWPNKDISYAEHLEYLTTWLTNRIQFMDTYIEKIVP